MNLVKFKNFSQPAPALTFSMLPNQIYTHKRTDFCTKLAGISTQLSLSMLLRMGFGIPFFSMSFFIGKRNG
jgi:hypothetical protein